MRVRLGGDETSQRDVQTSRLGSRFAAYQGLVEGQAGELGFGPKWDIRHADGRREWREGAGFKG